MAAAIPWSSLERWLAGPGRAAVPPTTLRCTPTIERYQGVTRVVRV